ncbi:hypothetical protein ACFQ7N_38290 [Streptomyces niveus]|uniref:hypothetical protein n=1 Tax=Streptomyces niveus TaxID=193462 RepID=UPI00369636EE
MSQLLDTLIVLAADPPPVIPNFTPSIPTTLQTPTGKILGWTAGIGLALAVLGGLSGWAATAIGHNTERGGMAARGKQAIGWSLIAGIGIGVTSGLIMGVYGMTQGA